MVGVWLELIKFRIVRVVLLTTLTGYLLGPEPRADLGLLCALLGTLLLAAGSAVLNQWQDAGLDARMARTRDRPIPSGRVRREVAFYVGTLLALLGAALLASGERHPREALVLGVGALAWYNVVYAVLKRYTAFAVVPGSLVGALPPLIGFVAAGGDWSHPFILLVAAFFFVWQVPHFWLLVLLFGEEYAEAGLPSLTRVFSPEQLRRLTALWLLAAAVAGLALACAPAPTSSVVSRVLLCLSSVWMAAVPLQVLRVQPARSAYGRAFARVNAFALAVIVSLSIGATL